MPFDFSKYLSGIPDSVRRNAAIAMKESDGSEAYIRTVEGDTIGNALGVVMSRAHDGKLTEGEITEVLRVYNEAASQYGLPEFTRERFDDQVERGRGPEGTPIIIKGRSQESSGS